jgi:hypothetical protein
LESWEASQHLLENTGKPRKTCVEMAGRRTYLIHDDLWPAVSTRLEEPELYLKIQFVPRSKHTVPVKKVNAVWENNGCFL